MISFVIDIIGDADARVGVRLVGEDGRAVRRASARNDQRSDE